MCVDCLFPLHDVQSRTIGYQHQRKKRYGWSACKSFSCSAKMASATNLQERPVPSSIARDRSLQSTSGKYKRRGNSDTVKVPLHERVRQFPDENFIVREGKLFCNACRQILSTKKNVLKIHVSSKKHQDGKQKLKRSKLREQTIAEAFKREESSKSKDSTSVEECAYRLEVVTEFLEAGIPIAKTDMLWSLLEKNGYGLTGSSNLGQYVSMALKQEIEQIKQELEMPGQVGLTRDISVIFDGGTRQGEAIALIVRFMDNDWNITQRLVRIEVCSKSVNANQLAQVLNQCLMSVEYGVRGNSLLAAMRDGASVNQAALNIVSFIFPNMVNVVCFSHTLDNVGNHFEIPTLKEFGSLWIRMFRNSCKAKLLRKDLMGRAPKSYSETRWWSSWSRWEVYQQLMVQFGDVERYMEEAKDAKVCPQILLQLQEILSDPQQHMLLKLELAATIDVGEHFVKATYFLEGDGPLILSCYEKLSAVNQACQAPDYPNVHAIATAIAREDPGQNVAALERRAKACVEPAITWFQRKFNFDLYDLLMAFKAARLFCPVSVQ